MITPAPKLLSFLGLAHFPGTEMLVPSAAKLGLRPTGWCRNLLQIPEQSGACGGSQEGCGEGEEVDDAFKLRRLGYLFPERPEALALAVVAVGGKDEKDLGEAARACGDGEGEGVKTKEPKGSLGRISVD